MATRALHAGAGHVGVRRTGGAGRHYRIRGATLIGIIAMSACRLTTKNIGSDKLLWAIFLISAAVTVITKSEIVWIFLGAGVLVWLVRAPPKFARGAMHSYAAPLLAWLALDTVDWPELGRIAPTSPAPAASSSAAVWRSFPFSMAAWFRNTTG